jgi:outer membrane PBP1 activator LpoA protein
MRCGVLHRWLGLLLTAAILYGGVPALASEGVVTSPAPPPRPIGAPLPLAPGAPGPLVVPAPPSAPAAAAQPAALSDDARISHVALLLPLKSTAFGQHAEAVRNGFLAAAKVQGRVALPLRIYETGDDVQQVVAGYRQALAAGATVVVGPLTRSGVTAIVEAEPVPVPTLALNVPEGRATAPRNLYMLSLQAEAEARQVAQLAHQEGGRSVLTVSGDTPLMRRIHQAFVDEFTRLGGKLAAEIPFASDPAGLNRIKQAAGLGTADMAFLALDFQRARLARPYLEPLAIFATSQVHPGNVGPLAAFDLARVRFLDMPWLLQPDHTAVMVYPRQDYRDVVELDRFYALGIDAFRVANELLAGRLEIVLDGVTGRLTLGPDQSFARMLTAAQFREGKLAVTGEPRR